MLQIKKITKVYKTGTFTQKALDNVSISFRKNEFVSILGPSGSGKTTLLNILGGLDQYTKGDLIINGISTKHYKDKDWDSYRNHNVGFVFQNYNLISHQSVLANVELALTLSGVSKKERRKLSREALIKVGLKEHMHKKPNELSGGQMQRVAIARALVNNPDILLADEPTGALDTETSKQIMDILKEVATDRLVIMVTHNPELALIYSTRVVKLLDGEIIEDSNPYEEEKEVIENTKTNKTNMSFITALTLSLNNLMTKKGRTILTSFAGSIGIIGIALIMSLSNGIQEYINKTEKETLSNYPLTIERKSIDVSSFIATLANNNSTEEYHDDKIHSINVMGDFLSSMSTDVKENDIDSFIEYLEKTNIKDLTTDIKYGYDMTLNIYKDSNDEVVRVNPTSVIDAIGMNTGGISSAYDSYMSRYDVFYEMIDNDKLNKQSYDLVKGKWPTKYNEIVLLVDKYNRITDYTLYSIGVLDQEELKEKFSKMTLGEEIEFESHEYSYDDVLGLKYRLVLNSSLYKKIGNNWVNMSNDTEYMKNVIKSSPELEIVGIIKPNDEAAISQTSGMVGYTHDLVEYMITESKNSDIVKEQLNNKEVNVFTNTNFSNKKFDMNDLTTEQLLYMQARSKQELAAYIENYNENVNSTYESNLKKLGYTVLEKPDSINLYPKDFDSKKEIEDLIEEYNKDKEDKDKITYTDLVGLLMSSVSTIVNVISSVLIAFVSISLVVSCIMIAIITYISVIERTKEIGILRSIGASKKDISRVFNAETLIEGLAAGILGIVVTLILNIPINIIIKNLVNISNISVLPIKGAILLIIISTVLTVIAGLIPSRMASKKDPVIALRTE